MRFYFQKYLKFVCVNKIGRIVLSKPECVSNVILTVLVFGFIILSEQEKFKSSTGVLIIWPPADLKAGASSVWIVRLFVGFSVCNSVLVTFSGILKVLVGIQ